MRPKLVRDRIPEIIKKNRQVPSVRIADEDEYWEKLKEKLEEEVNEFLEKSNTEELADILEVVYALCDHLGIDKAHLEEVRKKKAEERGGFKERIILDNVDE